VSESKATNRATLGLGDRGCGSPWASRPPPTGPFLWGHRTGRDTLQRHARRLWDGRLPKGQQNWGPHGGDTSFPGVSYTPHPCPLQVSGSPLNSLGLGS
jgi:hypothetical protein